MSYINTLGIRATGRHNVLFSPDQSTVNTSTASDSRFQYRLLNHSNCLLWKQANLSMDWACSPSATNSNTNQTAFNSQRIELKFAFCWVHYPRATCRPCSTIYPPYPVSLSSEYTVGPVLIAWFNYCVLSIASEIANLLIAFAFMRLVRYAIK